MNPKQWTKLRECCRDDAAFEQLQEILAAERRSVESLQEQVTRSQQTTERESSIIRVLGKLGQSIIDQVRQSRNFDRTLQAMLHEVRIFLNTDRVVIYRFNPDWSGEFISESVDDRWTPLLEEQQQNPVLGQNISDCQLKYLLPEGLSYTDSHLQATKGESLQSRESFIVQDIYKANFSDCYIQLLESLEAKAYVSVPISMGGKLWGLLTTYQNTGSRCWQALEVSLLTQVGNQLGAALQLADSIQEVQLQAERRQLIANIADRIRKPLDIQTILNTTAEDARHLFNADRVAVYRFNPDWNGEFIAESVADGWVHLVETNVTKIWEDTYLQETQGGRYQNNETFAVEDIYTVGHRECHIELLEQFQTRAYAIAPIFTGKNLWGLLAVYQNGAPRSWQPAEVDLLAQIGIQLGVALQQAELFANLHQEVAERQQAEQQVRQLNQNLHQRNAELEVVNQELEAFAYSVSHDLRAPLRSIDGFSQAILEDYTACLDETGQDYLRRIRSATQRMGQLIDDLLTLSRVTRSELRQETVNLSALAQAIATDLHQSDPSRAVEFAIQENLIDTGDPRLLRVVLINLLDNAWKFTSKKATARIEFNVTIQEDGKKIYFAKDDGSGFDMAYADKLFGPFQRLHSMSEFPGNGIGLATIQRIIHRHGGRVWAEGILGQGATFYFTLQ
ncbi:GAF domain-containing protein [Kovacikia minuta CCNUW1]|uniref:GAF domain-containing protein n=1 Tax=Kovacikia minuta TaxID=2931930 RepID=UPI001CCE2149|nr:GAF domain-containing protein [Kovacikia minuta]UBF25802.1 GAF domain-containing protein [Kovacikia minuta CCNUW1]